MERILNQSLRPISLQVSYMGVVNKEHTFERPVLLKNCLDENILATVWLPDSKDPITTMILPGWNPELIVKILVSGPISGGEFQSNSLQYGY